MENWNTKKSSQTNHDCSTTILLQQEIEHLKSVFTAINECSIKIVNRTVNRKLHQTHNDRTQLYTMEVHKRFK